MKNLKNYIIIILLLLLFISACYIALKKEPETHDKELSEARKNIARADSLQARSNVLVTTLDKRHVKDSLRIQELLKPAKRLVIRQAEQRKELKPVTDSIPAIAEAFETDDSLTLLYMIALDSCEIQKARQYQECKQIIILKDSAYTSAMDANKSLEKAIKRHKRREKVLKVMALLGVIGGFLIAL
jgi:septal ring-binding cell division protein DamX